MGSVGPWYPFFGRDFDAATASWSNQETGAYVRLLNHQWDSGFVSDDIREIASIIRETPVKARELWRRRLEAKFPAGTDGRRRNPRLAELRRKREEIGESNAHRGRLGAEKRYGRRYGGGYSSGHGERHSDSDSNGHGERHSERHSSPFPEPYPDLPPTHTPPPDPERAREERAEQEFEQIWAAYPPEGRKAKPLAQRAYLAKLRFAPPIEELLARLEVQKRSPQWAERKAIPNLDRWLEEARWLDGVPEAPAPREEGDPLAAPRRFVVLLERHLLPLALGDLSAEEREELEALADGLLAPLDQPTLDYYRARLEGQR